MLALGNRLLGSTAGLFILLALATTSVAAEKETFVVRAKVTKVGAKEWGSIPATLEIVHVYRGGDELKGKTFTDCYTEFGGGQSGGFAASRPFDVGEEGIWALMQKDGKLFLAWDDQLPFNRRSRKSEAAAVYARAVKVAEAIEGYEKVKADERPAAAEKLAADADPSVGYWAVRTLGDLEGKAADDVLGRLKTKVDLPVYAQIAVDQVLGRRKGSDWAGSKGQAKMHQGWVTGKADELHAHRIISRLSAATQEGVLEPAAAVELMIVAAGNADWRKEDRLRAVRWVEMHGSNQYDQERPFQWLAEQVRSNKDVEIQQAAAANLRGLRRAPDRLKTLSDLLDKATDEKVIAHLKATIKQELGQE